jgi:hypothetical protein
MESESQPYMANAMSNIKLQGFRAILRGDPVTFSNWRIHLHRYHMADYLRQIHS